MVVCREAQADSSEGVLSFENGMESKDNQSADEERLMPIPTAIDPLDPGWKSGEGVRYREKHESGTQSHESEGSPISARNRGEAFLDVLVQGANEPLDTSVPMDSRPPWLDVGLLKTGREFVTKYLFAIIYAHVPALAVIFSFQPGLEPIIFTGKSDTPFKAFRRYLSTVSRIVSWYETDFFDKRTEGYKSMAAVRIMHASVFKKMNEASEEEIRSKATVQGRGTGVWCTYLEDLKKDFRALDVDVSSCPFAAITSKSKEHGKFIYVNQLDLAYTQFGFVSMSILYPQLFGLHGATDEELEGYCHLWRCVGYHLGIKDRYNICSGEGLEGTRERCRAVIEKWVKPGLRDVTPDWEHMIRCLLEGLNHYGAGNTFGGVMAYLMWVLDIPAPNLRSKMTWVETALFYFHRFIFGFLVRIPGVFRILNFVAHRSLKQGRNASPEWLKQKEQKIYDYERVLTDKM